MAWYVFWLKEVPKILLWGLCICTRVIFGPFGCVAQFSSTVFATMDQVSWLRGVA